MSKCARLYKVGQGQGYTPPIDRKIFRQLVFLNTSIIVLAGLIAHIIQRIGW